MNMEPSNSPPSYHYRKWLVLFGSILLQLSIGSMFVFGNSIPYLASYLAYAHMDHLSLEKQDKQNTSANITDANTLYIYYLSECNWIFTTCYIVFTFSSLMGAHIQQQIGVKITLILSCLLMCVASLLCYFTLVNLYALIFCYLLFGCGAGIAYPISFVSCLAWFKTDKSNKEKGDLVIVLLNICFACSPFIFAPIQLLIINPNNMPIHINYGFIPHRRVMENIPFSYLYFTLIIAVMQFIAILLISNPLLQTSDDNNNICDNMHVAMTPHSCSCRMKKYIAYNSIYDISYGGDTAYYQMKPYEILLNGKFWTLWMIHLCCMMAYFFVILFWKIFAIQYVSIYNDEYLTIIISIAFILNGIFRFIWNKLFSNVNRIKKKKIILFAINLISCVFIASISLCKVFKFLYIIWIFIIFCVIGCDWILYPSLIAIVFGYRYNGYIVGYCLIADVFAIIIVCCICNHLLYAMYEMNDNSWQAFTWIIAAILLFSILLIIVFDPKKVIAERRLKDTMKTIRFPTYNSISPNINPQSDRKNCGCTNDCDCCHDDTI